MNSFPRWENRFVFLLACFFLLYWARHLLLQSNCLCPEVIVRTGLASDLWAEEIRGRQGLICSFWWPPLMTLLSLTFFALHFPFRIFLPAHLISVFSGGLTAFFINRLAQKQKVPPFFRWIFVSGLLVHPWVRHLFSTGTDYAVFLMLCSGTVFGLVCWMKEKKIRYFLLLNIFSGLALLCHPAGLLLVAAVLITVIIFSLVKEKDSQARQATILLYLTPVLYAAALWLLGNWVIMKDSLYFLRWVNGKTFFQNIFLTPGVCSDYFPGVTLLVAVYLSTMILAGWRNQKKIFCFFFWVIFFLVLTSTVFVFRHASQMTKENQQNWEKTFQEIVEDINFVRRLTPGREMYVVEFSGYLFRYAWGNNPGITHVFDLARAKIPVSPQPAYILIPSEKIRTFLPRDPFFHRYPDLPGYPPDFLLGEITSGSLTLFRLLILPPKN